ncbi:hypothetical protein GH714_034419 [Hevea brasiliensis]|uniref:Bromo domain-containing protein n=1 Tax=Hevea brasiliensis TaxID=3981 RepID=A0A6A6L4C7_HEVBR|nr:hypothetical protein GH714_034419 [Hevea brasiliensis]
MEPLSSSIPDVGNAPMGNSEGDSVEAEGFKHRVDELFNKVDKLEQRVNEVEQFYLNVSKKQQTGGSKGSSIVKDKDKERHVPSIRKQQQDASKREAAAGKRMQELMRQFGTILRQITQHKWAWPFMQPVDVKGLGLDDYYEVIDKPMDFSTIKNQMEAKDGTGYKNVREMCADVRLVFKNAMKYNDERSDVHVMAKTLLAKFEEKWLQLLPKVTEEEKRREIEEAEAQLDMQFAQEAVHAKMARELSNELYEIDMHLDELRDMVVQKCRKMSTEEKRKLGAALSRLSPEDLTKALEIVAQNNPGFQAMAEEVDLDIDAQVYGGRQQECLFLLRDYIYDYSLLQEMTFPQKMILSSTVEFVSEVEINSKKSWLEGELGISLLGSVSWSQRSERSHKERASSNSSMVFSISVFGTRSHIWSAKRDFSSPIHIAASQKRWASQARTTEDESRIRIGPRNGKEAGEDGKETGVVYYGPISSTIKKVKLLSLSTCCLSVSLGPVITFMTSPDMNVILKGAVASSVIFLSASTTAALHWFVSPYIHKLRWHPGSDSFEVEMMSWLATYIPKTIKFADIRPPRLIGLS